MVTNKNRASHSILICLAAVTLLMGCRPSGTRALLQGERLLERGDYPRAVERLKAATDSELWRTNAQAWNYLGLALHHAGRAAEAENAYQRALALNRDLTEVHYNLGCLWLGQNRLDAAKAELTAYTLQQARSVEGLLKLGTTELRLREPGPAETSFKEALRLDPRSAEALNGLGLVRLQRGRAPEAAQYFTSALKAQPGYGPALLNLAVVSQQYLKDGRSALQRYREYLALKPPPADTAAVSATVLQLEQTLNPSVRPAAASTASPATNHGAPPKALALSSPRATAVPRTEVATATPKPVPASSTPQAAPPTVEVVSLPAESAFKSAQDVAVAPPPSVTTASARVAAVTPAGNSDGSKAPRRGLLQRMNPLNLFSKGERSPSEVTPIPAAAGTPDGERTDKQATGGSLAAESSMPVASVSGRYAYRLPVKPTPGNRAEAERAFAQGVQAQKAHRLTEATQAYRTAAQADPAFFEAHYNLGLASAEAGNLRSALMAYESALAIQPGSADARYNFALALKQADYLADAADEMEKLLAAHPDEVRAHLALGNLYAQQLHQLAKARQHYLKVLEKEPHHSQADAIRYWLAANK